MSFEVLCWALQFEAHFDSQIPNTKETSALNVIQATRQFLSGHIEWQKTVLS